MGYIKIWFILALSSFVLSFLKTSNNCISLYEAYSTSKVYTLKDFFYDRELHLEMRKNFKNPYFCLLFVFGIFILNVFKMLIFLLSFLFVCYNLIRLLMLHFRLVTEEISMSKKTYQLKNYSDLRDLLIRLPLIISRSAGWVIAYNFFGILLGKKCVPNYWNVINNLLFIMVMGISWWMFYIVYEIVKEIFWLGSRQKIGYRDLCVLIVGCFLYKYNFFIRVSSKLRVYVEEGQTILNPKEWIMRKDVILQTIKIHSPTKGGRAVVHPGIKLVNDESYDTSLQMTGRPLDNDRGFKVMVKEYKSPYTFVVYNVLRDRDAVMPGYYRMLKNLNIEDRINSVLFQKLVFDHRLVMPGGLRYESFKGGWFIEGKSFIHTSLEHRVSLNLNIRTIEYYDLILNRWEKESKIDQDSVQNHLKDLGIVDFFEPTVKDDVLSYVNKKVLYDVNDFILGKFNI